MKKIGGYKINISLKRSVLTALVLTALILFIDRYLFELSSVIIIFDNSLTLWLVLSLVQILIFFLIDIFVFSPKIKVNQQVITPNWKSSDKGLAYGVAQYKGDNNRYSGILYVSEQELRFYSEKNSFEIAIQRKDIQETLYRNNLYSQYPLIIFVNKKGQEITFITNHLSDWKTILK